VYERIGHAHPSPRRTLHHNKLWHHAHEVSQRAPPQDCLSGVCGSNRVCLQPATCTNGLRDSNEGDVDCGALCDRQCGVSAACRVAADCISKVCTSGRCTDAPTCNNGLHDGRETGARKGGRETRVGNNSMGGVQGLPLTAHSSCRMARAFSFCVTVPADTQHLVVQTVDHCLAHLAPYAGRLPAG
jgi:hypothetical protein